MKNFTIKIFVLVLCLTSLNLNAQVAPVNKEMADKLEQQRKDYKRKEAINSNSVGQKEYRAYNYIQFSFTENNGSYEVQESNLEEYMNTEDKMVKQKLEFLSKLRELLNMGPLNLVSEFGKQGIKIVSHSFTIYEESEKHIYILEL